MPVCDGVEAAKRLRVLENKSKSPIILPSRLLQNTDHTDTLMTGILPVVALSADCQESTKQLCLSAGMNAFFSKPLKKSTSDVFLLKD